MQQGRHSSCSLHRLQLVDWLLGHQLQRLLLLLLKCS
jgi:hypothetical protein